MTEIHFKMYLRVVQLHELFSPCDTPPYSKSGLGEGVESILVDVYDFVAKLEELFCV